jgi:hypothetical protein
MTLLIVAVQLCNNHTQQSHVIKVIKEPSFELNFHPHFHRYKSARISQWALGTQAVPARQMGIAHCPRLLAYYFWMKSNRLMPLTKEVTEVK